MAESAEGAAQPPIVETPRTLETLDRRAQVINTVNGVYDLMRGVTQDLEGQRDRSPSQQKQIIDFKIAREGRKLLTGADVPITLDEPSDRFVNEVKDPDTGEVIRLNEGLPAEPFEDFLKGEIHDLQIRIASSSDPNDRALLRGVMERRQQQLGVIEQNSSAPALSEKERKARVRQEAYLIHIDPDRDTFSKENDWYTGEAVVNGRKFIDLGSRLGVTPSIDKSDPVLYTIDGKTGQMVGTRLPEDFGQRKVTDAYVDGYKAAEGAKRPRRMPSSDALSDGDMPDKDQLSEGEERTPDSLGTKGKRKMPGADSLTEEAMPDEDKIGVPDEETRVPDAIRSRSIIKDAYTGDSVPADQIIDAYGLQTAGDGVERRGRRFENKPLPRNRANNFSDLPNVNIPGNEQVVNGYGLATEQRPTPRRRDKSTAYSALPQLDIPKNTPIRNAFTIGRDIDRDKVRDRVRKTDVESRKLRLRASPRLLIPIIGLIGLALLADKFREPNVHASSEISSPSKFGGHEVAPDDFEQPFGPPNVEPKLTGHFYDSQPDASGSYGSLQGHSLYELAKVLDPTILADQMQTGKSVAGDDERIDIAIRDFQKSNPEKFEDVLDKYKQGIMGNNPPGTVSGEDAITIAKFNSLPMKDVYDQVMAQKGGTA